MKAIDFQGITSFEEGVIQQLEIYLREKEAQAGRAILKAIETLPGETLAPALPFNTAGLLTLSDSERAFARNVEEIAAASGRLTPANDWKSAAYRINKAFWEYLEVLEGCSTEFVQLISAVGFENWSSDLLGGAERIKEILLIRLNALELVIRTLEADLWRYRWALSAREGKNIFIRKIFYFWKSLVDRTLRAYLKRARSFLTAGYDRLCGHYKEYNKLKKKIDSSLKKLDGYHIFKSLLPDDQKRFRHLLKLLKFWRWNTKWKTLPEREAVRAIKSAYAIDSVTALFRRYFSALQNALFERSRKFKETNKELYTEPSGRNIIEKVVSSYRAELHTLGAAIEKYRKFFLSTHPNPYVRTKWGFSELLVGPEPKQTKELLSLIYEIEGIDKLFERLIRSLKRGPGACDRLELEERKSEISQILHEMGQPLISRNVMFHKAEKLLHIIEEMDELSSFCSETVEIARGAFIRALKLDWPYQTLFEIPPFYRLYSLHRSIAGEIEDSSYITVKESILNLLAQLYEYLKKGDLYRKRMEVERNIKELERCLGGFVIQAEKTIANSCEEVCEQLLECRYIFGKFFSFLRRRNLEGKLLRPKFMFVERYFDAVENRLVEKNL